MNSRKKQQTHTIVGPGKNLAWQEAHRKVVLGAFDTASYLLQRKQSDTAFSAVCSNLDKCRREAAGDVISSTALDYVGTDVPASPGDHRLNSGRNIRRFVRPDSFYALLCSIE